MSATNAAVAVATTTLKGTQEETLAVVAFPPMARPPPGLSPGTPPAGAANGKLPHLLGRGATTSAEPMESHHFAVRPVPDGQDEAISEDDESGSTSGTGTDGAEAASSPGELPSVGSALHASGKCSRCCFFLKNRCRNGVNCQFCHLPHERRSRGRGCRGHGGGSRKEEAISEELPKLPPQAPVAGPPPGLSPPCFLATAPPPPGLAGLRASPQGQFMAAAARFEAFVPSATAAAAAAAAVAPPMMPPMAPPRDLPEAVGQQAPPPPDNSPNGSGGDALWRAAAARGRTRPPPPPLDDVAMALPPISVVLPPCSFGAAREGGLLATPAPQVATPPRPRTPGGVWSGNVSICRGSVDPLSDATSRSGASTAAPIFGTTPMPGGAAPSTPWLPRLLGNLGSTPGMMCPQGTAELQKPLLCASSRARREEAPRSSKSCGGPLKVFMSTYACEVPKLDPQVPAKKRLPEWAL
mmetsp:Transcript_58442/g.118856  ORF Transcript_58442/g.118856 Transcript_58442/m.118856 type:complete len:468 (-) Transcript_58442:82-1485(-)